MNDGSDFGDPNWVGGLWNAHWVPAPYTTPPGLTDYAVEAEIKLASRPACGSFGIVARASYQVGVHICGVDGSPILSLRSSTPALLDNESIEVDEDWHQYRVEVQGSEIRALLDGAELAVVDDSRGPSAGAVGLWDDHTEIALRTFRVLNLQPR